MPSPTHDETPDTLSAPDTFSAKVQGAYSNAATLLENNPLAALLGGIALGAAAGALIPRSDREKQLLAPLGEKIADAARAALAAGREAGSQALADAGLSQDGLRDQVSTLFSQATSAAGAAGTAAFSAARDKVQG